MLNKEINALPSDKAGYVLRSFIERNLNLVTNFIEFLSGKILSNRSLVTNLIENSCCSSSLFLRAESQT